MPCERRSEIPSEGDARRCSYEVHVAPCAGVGAAVVDRRSAAAVVVGWERGLNPPRGAKRSAALARCCGASRRMAHATARARVNGSGAG